MRKGTQDTVVALGVFDGVHRGHQSIFRKVVQRAKKIKGMPVVYTFDPHPVQILSPQSATPMINTLSQRIDRIRKTGIRRVVVEKFTPSFSRQTPEKFFTAVVAGRLRARELYVGYNFTFGIHRSGTIEDLEALGRKAGIRVHIVEPFLWRETLVSSTEIRRLLSQGKLHQAEELLGYRYFLEGTVIHGRGVGGKELGIHTANLRSENDLILPTGVYITWTEIGGRRFQSVTNIGPNPTFGAGPLSIETHLLHFRKTIFGKRLRIEFVEKIREEIVFSSPRDLALQIRNDIRIAESHFKARKKQRSRAII